MLPGVCMQNRHKKPVFIKVFKKISFNTLFIGAGIVAFGLAFYFDRAWPVVLLFVLAGLYLLYLLLLAPSKDDYTFREEVGPVFTQMEYTILKERSLNFRERMNREPEININPGPNYTRRHLRKYHRVFTVSTKNGRILEVLTEILQHLDKEITVEILGTKEIVNS